MKVNMYNSAHKATSDAYRDGWDRIWGCYDPELIRLTKEWLKNPHTIMCPFEGTECEKSPCDWIFGFGSESNPNWWCPCARQGWSPRKVARKVRQWLKERGL